MLIKTGMALMAGAAFAVAAPAYAQDASSQAALAAPPQMVAQSPQKSDEPAALSNADLDQLRGGESVAVTNQTLLAITAGNVINGNYSAGDVTLSDNALSNFNGLGNVLINTGAQVSLQTGMNVTINVNQ
jgi:hypothetical protein